jgi:hypothetical protein
MGSNLWWATLVAGIVTLSAHAADLPLPSSGVRQITEDRWRAVLTQVQTTPGVDCQIIGSTRIYACVQRRGNGIWTFAMEGSPAFPAVSQSTVTPRFFCEPGYLGPKTTISRSAEYAGDRAAFEQFLGKLRALDQKFSAKQPLCGSQAKPWHPPNATP